MSILSGSDEVKKHPSTAKVAFIGRLAPVKLTMSTRSMPPLNYYKLEFEDKLQSLKGSIPTTIDFDYRQQGKGGQLVKADGSMKEPILGQFYVAICNSDQNKIDTLIEIDKNDISYCFSSD